MSKTVKKSSTNKVETLRDKSIDVVVNNFAQLAIEKKITIELMPDIIKKLPYDLPPLVTLKYIQDDGNGSDYWKNCCLKKYERYDCRLEDHGHSWKRLYFEKLITEKLESFEDISGNDNNNMSRNSDDSGRYSNYHTNTIDNFHELLLLIESTQDIVESLFFQQLPSHLDISEVISRLPHLQKLDIEYGYKKTGMNYDRLQFGMKVSDASFLARIIPTCRNLTIIKLTENLIDDDILRILMSGLINNNTITSLDLSHNLLSNHGARYIAKLLGQNSILENLNLANNQIQSEGGKYLARALREGGKLKWLNLRLNQLQDDGCALILEGLLDNPALQYLNISSNGAENKTAEALVTLFRSKDSSITDCDVSNNKFTAGHMVQFQKAIEKNKCLKSFDLRMNPGYVNLEQNDILGDIQRILQENEMSLKKISYPSHSNTATATTATPVTAQTAVRPISAAGHPGGTAGSANRK